MLPLARKTLSEDEWGAEDVFVSWLQRGNRPDELANRASVLLPDVLRSDVKVNQRGLDLCMPHELHQRREANARAHHVQGEGVPKPVRVRLRYTCGSPVMTEQGTQTGRCHFETNEESLATKGRPLQTQIVIEEFHGFAGERQHANPLALAQDPDLRVRELDVLAVER